MHLHLLNQHKMKVHQKQVIDPSVISIETLVCLHRVVGSSPNGVGLCRSPHNPLSTSDRGARLHVAVVVTAAAVRHVCLYEVRAGAVTDSSRGTLLVSAVKWAVHWTPNSGLHVPLNDTRHVIDDVYLVDTNAVLCVTSTTGRSGDITQRVATACTLLPPGGGIGVLFGEVVTHAEFEPAEQEANEDNDGDEGGNYHPKHKHLGQHHWAHSVAVAVTAEHSLCRCGVTAAMCVIMQSVSPASVISLYHKVVSSGKVTKQYQQTTSQDTVTR